VETGVGAGWITVTFSCGQDGNMGVPRTGGLLGAQSDEGGLRERRLTLAPAVIIILAPDFPVLLVLKISRRY